MWQSTQGEQCAGNWLSTVGTPAPPPRSEGQNFDLKAETIFFQASPGLNAWPSVMSKSLTKFIICVAEAFHVESFQENISR